MKKSKYLIFLIITVLMLTITGCTSQTITDAETDKSYAVVICTTIYPLYDFASNVGGEKVRVINLLPAGAEPHSWEPSPQAIALLQQADLFVYCGAGLEPWAEQVISSFGEKGPTVVDSSKGIELIKSDGDEHHHGSDPHIWLDPLNAKQQVENILTALIKIDPENAAYYREQAQAYCRKLDALDEKYRERLANAPLKKFITSHDAFGYLAKRYGLEQISIRGVNPEMEPTPARLAEIISLAKENNIKYIFFESLINPKVSETIAAELGGDTLVLNPISSLTEEEINQGKNYLSLMEENLYNLELALGVSDEQ